MALAIVAEANRFKIIRGKRKCIVQLVAKNGMYICPAELFVREKVLFQPGQLFHDFIAVVDGKFALVAVFILNEYCGNDLGNVIIVKILLVNFYRVLG